MIQQILHVCIFYWRIIFAMTSPKQIIWSLFREGWGAGVHKHDPRAGGVVQIPIAIARHICYVISYIVCLLSEVCWTSEDVHGGRQGHQVNKHIIRTSISSASFTNNAMFTQIFLLFSKVLMIRNQTTIKPGDNMGTKSIGNLFEVLSDLFWECRLVYCSCPAVPLMWIKSKSIFQTLRSRSSKGVMAVVENLSNRMLDEPEFHARCKTNPKLYIQRFSC